MIPLAIGNSRLAQLFLVAAIARSWARAWCWAAWLGAAWLGAAWRRAAWSWAWIAAWAVAAAAC